MLSSAPGEDPLLRDVLAGLLDPVAVRAEPGDGDGRALARWTGRAARRARRQLRR